MNDQFLYRFRKQPGEEYAQRLSQRLAHSAPDPRPSAWALTAAAGLALAGILLLTIPVARRSWTDTLWAVGQFHVPSPYPQGANARALTPAPCTLDQALARFPLPIHLPQWAPEGYRLTDQAELIFTDDPALYSTQFTWAHNQWGRRIDLKVQYTPGAADWQATPGQESQEDAQINGQPAALVHGVWNADEQAWEAPDQISLYWRDGDLSYQLQTRDNNLSTQDLVRMAESIP